MTERVIFSSKHINHIYHYFVSVIAHVITYNAALALALASQPPVCSTCKILIVYVLNIHIGAKYNNF